MSKEAYYFSHDCNARTDPKILQMRSVYKSEGYGWYWILIEMLRDEEDYALSIEGKYVWDALAMQMDTTAEKAHAFVEDCVNEFKLFESDQKYFWSSSLRKRMKIKTEKSEKAKKSAESRWHKNIDNTNDKFNGNANALNEECEINAIKERKGKEKKRNNIYSSDSNEYRLSKLLQELILVNDNKNRASKADLQKWAVHVDRLLRVDGREVSEIEKVIRWSQQNDFWKSNILSTEKLRKQFDTLKAQMNSGNGQNRNNTNEKNVWLKG